jgi:hypothetical protein
MDVLLTLCEDRLFRWVWTDELLDEWEAVIVREHQRTLASARSVTDAVRTHFAAGRIDRSVRIPTSGHRRHLTRSRRPRTCGLPRSSSFTFGAWDAGFGPSNPRLDDDEAVGLRRVSPLGAGTPVLGPQTRGSTMTRLWVCVEFHLWGLVGTAVSAGP